MTRFSCKTCKVREDRVREDTANLESKAHLDEELPYDVFREGLFQFLAFLDVSTDVSSRGVFHDDAKKLAIDKSLVVTDLSRGLRLDTHLRKGKAYDIGMLDRCKQVDLVNSVDPLELRHLADICFLDSVYESIGNAFHFVDGTITAFSQKLLHLEIDIGHVIDQRREDLRT